MTIYAPKSKERIQLNVALAHFTKLNEPRKQPVFDRHSDRFLGHELVLEHEQELEQHYLEIKRLPVREEHVDAMLRQMNEIVKYELKKRGFMQG